MKVNCPNCGCGVEVQIFVVKDDDLPVRPAECEKCFCDFDVFHDGRIELLRAPPKESDPAERKGILEKIKNLEFDPTLDDDDDIYKLARDVSDQLSIIINAVGKDNAKEVIALAAGEIQSLAQKACEEMRG